MASSDPKHGCDIVICMLLHCQLSKITYDVHLTNRKQEYFEGNKTPHKLRPICTDYKVQISTLHPATMCFMNHGLKPTIARLNPLTFSSPTDTTSKK